MEYILSICLLITLSFDDKSSPDKSRTPPLLHRAVLVPSSGVFAICVSQIFWNNPVRYSIIIHKIDRVIAKLSILLFIGYILCYKKMDISMTYAFILIITWMIYFLY